MLQKLQNVLRRSALHRLRARLRARYKLAREGRSFEHMALFVNVISAAPLGLPTNACAGLTPRAYTPEVETLIRQRASALFTKSARFADLARHCAGDDEPMVLVLPKAWRAAARNAGVRIGEARSWLGWLAVQGRLLKSGVACYFGHVRRGWAKTSPETPYAVFVHLHKNHVPQKIGAKGEHKDLINWYRHSDLFDERVKAIWMNVVSAPAPTPHDKALKLVRHPFALLRFGPYAAFCVKGAAKCLVAVLGVPLGRWWAPIILREAIDLSYARGIAEEDRACDYFFHNAVKKVRPLWTYEMERTGSRVTCIMFSHNIYPIDPGHPETPMVNVEYHGLSWGRYAVWNKYHAQAMLDLGVRPAAFVEVGPVSMIDDQSDVLTLPPNAVAIFDVNAVRPSREVNQGLVRPYLTTDNMLAFLDQACLAVKNAGGVPVIKPKREFGESYYQAHRFRAIIERHGALCLDPKISGDRLSQMADAVIACPFTSVPTYAQTLGKPACYFDPTQTLNGFEAFAHGNTLVVGQQALAAWLSGVLNTSGAPRRRAHGG